jgi:hypothetical protein
MIFEVESLSAPSRYMRTTWMLYAQTELKLPSSVVVRRFGKDEALLLAENIRRRNVFARHSRENNFYLQRIAQLASQTVIEVSLPGDPRDMAEEAGEVADLVEKVAILSTTIAATKSELQRRLGISSRSRS